MKSAKTQSSKNVVSVHLRNTTTSNKTVRIIHMPTREEAIRMFIRFLRNHNEITKHVDTIKQGIMSFNNFGLAEKCRYVLYWRFWKGVQDSAKFISASNTNKRNFTHDYLHLFDTLSDTWRA